MAIAEDIARDEAIAWRIRLADADEREWDAFLEWLDRDPANRVAYDRVALTDSELGEALGLAGPEDERKSRSERRPPHRQWRYAAWVTTAAAVFALIFFGYPILFAPRSLQAIETAGGVQRVVALGDGSTVYLNGGSRLLIDRNSRRFVRLDRGEATFEVAHDSERPFTVKVNGATIRDLGTVFNISTSREGFELAVAAGAVVLNPGAENVRLARGGVLFVPRGAASIRVGSKSVEAIASWRRGRLVYDGEPIGNIALDLSRALGTPVSVAPPLSRRPFTGVIILVRDQELLFHRLEHLLHAKANRSEAGWRLEPADSADKAGSVRLDRD